MAKVIKEAVDQLKRLKKNVDYFREYFAPNYKRFNDFRRFIFDTSLNQKDLDFLNEVKKPQIEFNYGEAYLSRLIGEFSKQEPSITVSAGDGVVIDQNLTKTIDFVEGHLRYILFRANNDSFENSVYKDVMSGGFSGMKIWTDYCNEMAFNQDIYLGKVFSPTLMGFDPLAQLPHKGDGEYCFELYPKRVEELKRDFPQVAVDQISFIPDVKGYHWSYETSKDKIALVCDYYEKKKKKKKIVRLANNKTMFLDDYEKELEKWNSDGKIEQPAVVIDSRWTEVTIIVRYRFVENQMLEYIETDYDELPIVFVDGNSIVLDNAGSYFQMTRPYLYHSMGIQKLINFAGQTLGGELQNMVQHKWKIASESINPQYADALKDNQIPSVLVYNAFLNNNPGQPVPPPQEIMRAPCPPEIMNTFMGGSQIFQNIMGSYDASLGINDNQLSGVAIVEGASQSNAVAMPHIMGFLQAFNQIAQIAVKLIPKYMITPRSVPVRSADGKQKYVLINQPGGIDINYCSNDLQVKVVAGVNFNVQKNKTLQQITQMMSASPIFAQFMNQKGLKVLVSNMDIRGQDELSLMAEEFMEEMKAMQAKQQQTQGNAPNPLMLKAQNDQQRNQLEQQKIMQQSQQMAMDQKLDGVRVMNDLQKTENERMNIMLKAKMAASDNAVQIKKADTEAFAHATDLALKSADQSHRHAHTDARLLHDVSNSLISQAPSDATDKEVEKPNYSQE